MELTIRKMEEGDLEALLVDPAVMRYLEPPYTPEQAGCFLRAAGLCEPPLIYAAEEDGRFIGYVIFHDFDADSVEIGWVLRADCWGRGCASRLTEELIRRAFSRGRGAVIECSPEQEVTAHLARKYGFAYEGRAEGLDVFRLQKREREEPPEGPPNYAVYSKRIT